MSDRLWDRIGAASGVVFFVLAFVGLTMGGSSRQPPRLDASSAEILNYLSQPKPQLASVGNAVALTGFVFFLFFVARLWATLRQAEGGTGWQSLAAMAGAVLYFVFELSRAVLFDAARPGVGHGLDASEAVVLWDISNSVTVMTWTAIAMFMLPVALVALRKRALPLWLGVVTAIIAVANLVFGWLPPGGPSSPGEFAFLFWVPVTSIVLFF